MKPCLSSDPPPPPHRLVLCVRLSQRLTRKGWSPGSCRSSNCSACFPGKLCWTCLCIDRRGETPRTSLYLSSPLYSTEVASAVVRPLAEIGVFLSVRSTSWTYGSNSLPTAGSVSGGVARRGQRQFQMTPRGLPAGRMGLLSPSGIGGASPRHTLTSPALTGQGRQVSIPEHFNAGL